jgi:hypothetical protein
LAHAGGVWDGGLMGVVGPGLDQPLDQEPSAGQRVEVRL